MCFVSGALGHIMGHNVAATVLIELFNPNWQLFCTCRMGKLYQMDLLLFHPMDYFPPCSEKVRLFFFTSLINYLISVITMKYFNSSSNGISFLCKSKVEGVVVGSKPTKCACKLPINKKWYFAWNTLVCIKSIVQLPIVPTLQWEIHWLLPSKIWFLSECLVVLVIFLQLTTCIKNCVHSFSQRGKKNT